MRPFFVEVGVINLRRFQRNQIQEYLWEETMLPEVTLNKVSREDVDRVAGWLQDDRVASRWFGHYACGDPVHRGYEPAHMVEASDSEWDRVFVHDPHRFIYSIYNEWSEHIGESQVMVDERGGAELSLLIGRTDLWHRGYGTSTVMALLDQVFDFYRLDRAWVNVPDNNTPAVGLFKKLGFVHKDTSKLCQRRDGSAVNSLILSIESSNYQPQHANENRSRSTPVVTVAGLPGSGFESLGAEIADITGSRFLDDEISEMVGRRLRRSVGELDALKSSSRSFWSRTMRSMSAHWEQYGATDDPSVLFGPRLNIDSHDPLGYINKQEYLEGFRGVITELALEGNTVLCEIGANLYIPSKVPAFRLLVMASDESRQRRIAGEFGLDPMDAEARRTQLDRDSLAMCKHLYGHDLIDVEYYDLVLNVDRMTQTRAAESIASMLEGDSATIQREFLAAVR